MDSKLAQILNDPEFQHRVESGLSAAAIHRDYLASRYGIGERMARRCVEALRKGGAAQTGTGASLRVNHADNTAIAEINNSPRVLTLEQLLRKCEVSEAEWEVVEHVVNKWDQHSVAAGLVELYQVKARLKRREDTKPLIALLNTIEAKIKKHAIAYPKHSYPKTSGEPHLYEISLVDAHFGKHAWGKETGGDDYDLAIAEQRFCAAIDDLLHKSAGFNLEEILLVIGNDLLQVDNEDNETTRGTRQDVDSRYKKVFTQAGDAQVWAIERCLERAPVRVVVVPGNHDRLSAFQIGRYLEAWFRKARDVTIDNSPPLRKYVRYGTTLLGFSHGSEEKHADLPLIMAEERKEDWAATTHREWHLGHYHTRKETRYVAGDTFKGVGVRILPSLCEADAWHYEKGYVNSPKAAEAYLWGRESGYAGHFSSSPLLIKKP